MKYCCRIRPAVQPDSVGVSVVLPRVASFGYILLKSGGNLRDSILVLYPTGQVYRRSRVDRQWC